MEQNQPWVTCLPELERMDLVLGHFQTKAKSRMAAALLSTAPIQNALCLFGFSQTQTRGLTGLCSKLEGRLGTLPKFYRTPVEAGSSG